MVPRYHFFGAMFILQGFPNYGLTSQKMMRLTLYAMGATDDTLLEYLEIYNERCEEMIAQSPNGQ